MYKIITKNDTKEYNHDDFLHHQFLLKCKGENFTVIYPSGYIAFFKPIEE